MMILLTVTMIVFVPMVTYALDVSPAYMKVGSGATFTTLPADASWNQMMSVGPITLPVSVVCTVTASFTVPLYGELIQTTIATAPNARGPWVQVHEAEGWESSAMVQAFVVPANTATTFYMNGQNLGLSSVMTQNTRIWASCQQGSSIPTADAYEGEPEIGN